MNALSLVELQPAKTPQHMSVSALFHTEEMTAGGHIKQNSMLTMSDSCVQIIGR